jgi:hypothetical protein
LLADHGVLGTGALMILWFLPLIAAFVVSQTRLFVIPYLSLLVHLFLAYGTFTWSIIWINLIISLWGLRQHQKKSTAISSTI